MLSYEKTKAVQIIYEAKNKMKKLFQYLSLAVLGAVVTVIATGCCHAEVFTEPVTAGANTDQYDGMQPVAVGKAYNTGYYLFNTWPLYTGNIAKYNRKDYHSFHDDITPVRNSSILLEEMRKKHQVEKLADVEHQESSWGYFSLWIVWRKNICTTATGLKTPPPPKPDKDKKNRK